MVEASVFKAACYFVTIVCMYLLMCVLHMYCGYVAVLQPWKNKLLQQVGRQAGRQAAAATIIPCCAMLCHAMPRRVLWKWREKEWECAHEAENVRAPLYTVGKCM